MIGEDLVPTWCHSERQRSISAAAPGWEPSEKILRSSGRHDDRLCQQIEGQAHQQPRGGGDAWHVDPLVGLVEVVATRSDHYRRDLGLLREEIHVPESPVAPFWGMTRRSEEHTSELQ